MKTKTFPYDSADYVTTPEAQGAYLADLMQDADPRLLIDALNTVARARKCVDALRASGVPVDAEQLDAATLIRGVQALGLRLTVTDAAAAEAAPELAAE